MRGSLATSGLRCAALLLGVVAALLQSTALGQATGTRKIGSWVVVTNDKADGRKDAAAIVSEPGSPFGLALRCIDDTLSAALVPLRDEQLFGDRGRAVTVSLKPEARPALELAGRVADDRSLNLADPVAVLGLVLAASRMTVSTADASGGITEASLDLRATARALADLIRSCPAGLKPRDGSPLPPARRTP